MAYFRLGNKTLTSANKLLYPNPIVNYPTQGLVARWTFENSLIDSINGIQLDSPIPWVYTPGKVGLCIYNHNNWFVSGIETRLYDYTVNTYCGVNNFTYAFWLKRIINNFHGSLITGGNYFGQASLLHYSPVIQDTIFLYNRRTGNVDTNIQQSPLNVWTHYAVSFDGTYTRVYENGNIRYTQNNNQSLTAPCGGANIVYASRNDTGWYYDNFYLYNRALTGAEINQIYNNGIGV